jgi:hypothetical protein
MLAIASSLSWATSEVTVLQGPTRRLSPRTADCEFQGAVSAITIRVSDEPSGSHSRLTARCRFNTSGLMVEEWLYTDIGQRKPAVRRTVNVYDAQGRLEEVDSYEINEDPHRPDRYLLRYDGAGRMIASKQLDKDGELHSEASYEYDAAGDLIREVVRFFNQTVTITGRQYDSEHHVTEERRGDDDGKRYRYDALGRKIEEIFGRSGSCDLIYSYNSQGLVQSVVNSRPQAVGCTAGWQKLSYRYNSHGLETEEAQIGADGHVLQLSRYEYDNQDNPVREWIYFAARKGEPEGSIVADVDGTAQTFARTNGLLMTAYDYDRYGNWVRAVTTAVPRENPAGSREVEAVTTRHIRYR